MQAVNDAIDEATKGVVALLVRNAQGRTRAVERLKKMLEKGKGKSLGKVCNKLLHCEEHHPLPGSVEDVYDGPVKYAAHKEATAMELKALLSVPGISPREYVYAAFFEKAVDIAWRRSVLRIPGVDGLKVIDAAILGRDCLHVPRKVGMDLLDLKVEQTLDRCRSWSRSIADVDEGSPLSTSANKMLSVLHHSVSRNRHRVDLTDV